MNYESNSNKSKEKKKNIKQVATGTVKKKSFMEKVANSFIQSDADNIKDYIISDVLIPAAKKAIDDVVSNGIKMLLYGKGAKKNNSNEKPYTKYNKCYSGEESKEPKEPKKVRYGFSDIALDSLDDAEEVLTNLRHLIEEYGVVSVADYYDLVGVDSNYTDNNWGWTDLRTAYTAMDQDGYKVKLPKAVSLD